MKVKRLDSSDQNVCKYVFDFGDAVAEAVLYKYPTYEERTVMCISTQSGCPVGCTFCGTGKQFIRNLTAFEIDEQVNYILDDKKLMVPNIKKLQIMFMSMGEPLLNFTEVKLAIECLHIEYPNADLLISTSGPRKPEEFKELAELSQKINKIGLQFSVHESKDTARNLLIPFTGKMSLGEIAYEGQLWYGMTGRKPFFNYCAHANNTSDADVFNLLSLFDPFVWNATISVICEKDEKINAALERQAKLAADFAQKLLSKGFNVRVFNPAGQDDIGGGCGQLWHTQKWIQERRSK